MKRWLTVQHLLVFTVLTGMVNIIIFLDCGKTDSLSQTSRSLGRQIASIDEDARYQYSNIANYGHLEMLNSDLKETLDKYSASTSTLGQAFIQTISGHNARSFKKGYARQTLIKCFNGNPFLLIQVHSKPENFISREAIRLSWGSPDNAINKGSWTRPER